MQAPNLLAIVVANCVECTSERSLAGGYENLVNKQVLDATVSSLRFRAGCRPSRPQLPPRVWDPCPFAPDPLVFAVLVPPPWLREPPDLDTSSGQGSGGDAVAAAPNPCTSLRWAGGRAQCGPHALLRPSPDFPSSLFPHSPKNKFG